MLYIYLLYIKLRNLFIIISISRLINKKNIFIFLSPLLILHLNIGDKYLNRFLLLFHGKTRIKKKMKERTISQVIVKDVEQ